MQVRESCFIAITDDIYKIETDIVLKDLLRGLYKKIMELESVYYLRRFCNLASFQFKYESQETWQFSLSTFIPIPKEKLKEIDYLFDIIQNRISK